MTGQKSNNCNVLTLDGGGVRGLSTVIILEDLMSLVNDDVEPELRNHTALLPRDVFDLVVGTSTGGLIALMLVKFGYNADQCIQLYQRLSKEIFSHKHFLGTITGGLGRWSKFCGKHLRKVVISEVFEAPCSRHQTEDYQLENIDDHPKFCCAVCDSAAIGTLTTIRSCVITDAEGIARMKAMESSHVKIRDKVLVDGGYGVTNNPSKTAFDHYFELKQHNFGQIRVVNIGTGTDPSEYLEVNESEMLDRSESSKSWIDHIPGVRNVITMLSDLTELATDSEDVAKTMKSMESAGPTLKFHRFSADKGGIHLVRLHEYKRNDEIIRLTKEYLRDMEVRSQLEHTAHQLAETYKSRVRGGH